MTKERSAKNRMLLNIGLVALILVLLGTLFLGKQNLKSLDTYANSLHTDRLMAATYLFNIHDNLFNIQESRQKKQSDSKYWTAIDTTVAQFETTWLTDEELVQWRSLKTQMESWKGIPASQDSSNIQFIEAAHTLSGLMAIQKDEGDRLLKQMHVDVSSNYELITLGITLLVILSIILMATFNYNYAKNANLKLPPIHFN